MTTFFNNSPIIVQAATGNACPANCVVAKHVKAIARQIVWHARAFPCVSRSTVMKR